MHVETQILENNLPERFVDFQFWIEFEMEFGFDIEFEMEFEMEFGFEQSLK